MTHLSELTAPQRRVLAFLDDGHNAEDAVGRELEELERKPGMMAVAERLVAMGLAERRAGPGVTRAFSAWYRLTDAGRKLRDEGMA